MKASGRTLVHSFIEKVSGKLLEEEYRGVVAGFIHGHAGVYALYKDDKLYYVGLASNLMYRVRSHLKDRHSGRWDLFSVYLTVPGEHVKLMESLLLRIFRPNGNRVSGKLPGAADAKRALVRAMRERDVDRRASLLGGHASRRVAHPKSARVVGAPTLAGLVARPLALQASYKGKTYAATLYRNGCIAYAGRKFATPTAAALQIVDTPVNGWRFWKFRGADGKLARLETLRR
jgi:hypothetical protein